MTTDNNWFNTLHETLTPTQVYARDFIVSHPKCGIFLDMGGGKTLTTLAALSLVKDNHNVLVIAPNTIADSTWPEEIDKWNIPYPTTSLHITAPSFYKNGKPKKQRNLKPQERGDIYATISPDNPGVYIAALPTVTEIVDYFGKKWPFDIVILDESQSFKNHTSKRTKALRKVSKLCSRLILLTGTPSAESLDGLWSQMYLLDRGARLGHSMLAFHHTYFRPGRTIPGIGVVEWTPLPGAEEDIYDAISDITVHLENHDLNIPDKYHRRVYVDLPDEVYSFCKELTNASIAEAEIIAEDLAEQNGSGNPDDFFTQAVSRTAGALHNKLMQCAAGSLIIQDLHPDDPAYAQATQITSQPVMDIHTKKFDLVEDIVATHNRGYTTAPDSTTSTVAKSPVLIAYRFIAEKERLLHQLTKHGFNAVAFDGSPDMIKAWNEREYDAMLIHPASAGHGLNLQHGGNVLVWSTLPDSAEQYLQTNARLHRPGQSENVYIYEIMAKNTIDAKVADALTSKKDAQQELLDALTHDIAAQRRSK